MAPEDLAYAAIWLAVTLYAVLGGADFGAGIWDAITLMRMPAAERRLLYGAIGPVWEANHVWLVFALVLTMTAFPPAFAALAGLLWLPLLLALAGIVFRGAAFVFRAYGPDSAEHERGWSATFGVASTLTPVFFGLAAGALAGRTASSSSPSLQPPVSSLQPLLRALPILCALLATTVCAYLAAVYLTREGAAAKSKAQIDAWRRRALGAGLVAGVLAAAGLVVMALDAPRLWDEFRGRALPFVALSGLAAATSFVALLKSRFTLAAAGAAAAVGSVLLGAGAATYPYLVAPHFGVADHAPRAVIVTMLWVSAAGMAVVVPSLLYLLRIFKSMPGRR